MKCSIRPTILFVVMCLCAWMAAAATAPITPPSPPSKAKWTVMVYMNADNNLEADAIADFAEMAAAPDTSDVRVVVQLKRGGRQIDDSTPIWSGARRYLLQKGEAPDDASKISDLGDVNMGDGHTVADFINWAMSTYPADRYALIVWSHGAGWRDIEVKPDAPVAPASAAGPAPVPAPPAPAQQAPPVQPTTPKFSVPNGVTAVSFKSSSEDHGDQLYNAELATAISYALGGRKLDLLAFDSCLMGMVETAYAMRSVASVLVASEELVPRYGFNYTTLTKALNKRIATPADATAFDFAQMMLDTYKAEYTANGSKTDPQTTLSAVDLTTTPALSAAVTSLSLALIADLPKEKKVIQDARAACSNFAPPDPTCHDGDLTCQSVIFHHIDLRRFASLVAGTASDPRVKSAATGVMAAVDAAIGGHNYAGAARSGGKYGAAGLAIYFPPDGLSYTRDPFNDGSYNKPATNNFLPYPLEFVGDQQWADFLQAYYKVVPQ